MPHFSALCKSFGIQHKPTRVFRKPRSEYTLEISNRYSWWWLICWPKMTLSLSAASSGIVCPQHHHCLIHHAPSVHCSKTASWVKQFKGRDCCLAVPLLLAKPKTMETTGPTTKLIILYPLKKLWWQGWWMYWYSEQRYITPHKMQSIWQWYLDYHKVHTIEHQGFMSKVIIMT